MSAVVLFLVVAVVTVSSNSHLHGCNRHQEGQMKLADMTSSSSRNNHVEVCWQFGSNYYWLPVCKHDSYNQVASFICQQLNSNATLASEVVQFQLPPPVKVFKRSQGKGIAIMCPSDSSGKCTFTIRNCESESSSGTTVCVYPQVTPTAPVQSVVARTPAFSGDNSAMVTSTHQVDEKRGRKNGKKRKTNSQNNTTSTQNNHKRRPKNKDTSSENSKKRSSQNSPCVTVVSVLAGLLCIIVATIFTMPILWICLHCFMFSINTGDELDLEHRQVIRQNSEGTHDKWESAPIKVSSTQQPKKSVAAKSGAKLTASGNACSVPGDTTYTDQRKGKSDRVIERP